MINHLTVTTNRSSWNLINTSVAVVIIINYFNIFHHHWFVKLLGGNIIKIWFPTVFLLSLLAMRTVIKNRSIFIRKDSIYSVKIFCLFYFIFGFISLVSHGEGMHYLGKYSLVIFIPVILFGIIVTTFYDNEYIKKVLQLLFVGGLIITFYVEYLYFVGGGFVDTMVFESTLGSIFRHGMPGLGVSTYAGMLPPLILTGLYMALKNTGFIKYFYYASTIFISYAAFATMSRAAFISLIIGLFIFLWYFSQKKYFTYITIIMVFIGTIWLNISVLLRILGPMASAKIFSASKFITNTAFKYNIYNSPYTNDPHIEVIRKSISAFSESPLFGVGFNEMMIVNEHNRYIEVLASNGLAVFIPYVGLIITIIIISRKMLLNEIKFNGKDKEIGALLFAGLIAFVIYMNAAPDEFYFYWIWFALVLAWAKNCSRAQLQRQKYLISTAKNVNFPNDLG